LVSDLLSWIVRSRSILADLDEHMVGRYLRHRAGKRPIQRADCAALRRWLLVLRDAGTIAPSASAPIIPQDQISAEFGEYLQKERGLAPRSILRLLPTAARGVARERRPGQDPADVVRYVEHHARDASPKSARVMCSSLRAFLRYVHHKGLNPFPLAGCVPSKREWKLAHLPTYLSAEQVQNVLDSCDRATPSVGGTTPSL
jgi:hypothetical protein